MDFENYRRTQNVKNNDTIAIDFDGVIHRNSKGFHDGTIYDEPIEKSLESIKYLYQKGYEIVIYSCKLNPDRPLINGKTGEELMWEWLEKHGFKEYISNVSWGKPWATLYVDDKGLRFTDWDSCLLFIKEDLH